jgi:hypothetical protein
MTTPIAWNHDPEPESKTPKLKLLRCPQGSLPPFVILSDRQFGGDMHFYGGRSIPCEGKECPYCAVHSKTVWKGYLAVWEPKTRGTGILEFTKPCLETIRTYRAAHGTLRTHSIQLNRAGRKINGALSAVLSPTTWAHADLPEPPDVIAILTKMWNQRPETIMKPQPPKTETTMETEDESNRTVPINPRFTTEGSPKTKIYETTPEQREMLRKNRDALAAELRKNGEAHK